jgi:type I restriction enzyme S subunit
MVDPADWPEAQVPHYSIPSLDETGSASHDDRDSIGSSKLRVQQGDSLVSKLNPHKPRVHGVTHPEALASSEFVVLRAPKVDPRFMRYFLRSDLASQDLTSRMRSVTRSHQRATDADVLNLVVPIVEAEQSSLVADFLDRETSRIDSLVEAKRKLIDLLAEKRAALIAQAITRGLNPSVATTETPIGRRPNHWSFGPLKRHARDVTVGIVVQPARLYVETGVPCLRGVNVSPGQVSKKSLAHISAEANAAHRKSILQEGDVVVVRTGRAGSAAVVPGWAVGGNCVDLLLVRPAMSLVPRYLEFLLNSSVASRQVDLMSVGAIQSHYNVEALAELRVALPPVEEQGSILQFLDSKVGAIDATNGALKEQLTLLAEYRQALITAAVTGQLDEATLKGHTPADKAMEFEVPV